MGEEEGEGEGKKEPRLVNVIFRYCGVAVVEWI